MRIAIWVYGGIGGGNFSQGIPTINNLISRLAKEHDVTIYSILPANADFIPVNFKFRSVMRSIPLPSIRILFLTIIFFGEHLRKPYDIMHGIWAYPASTIAVALGKLLGIPSIASVHGGEAACIPKIGYGNMYNSRSKKLTLWTCHNASALNFISEFQYEEMQRHGLKRKNVSVIPFGADIEMFAPLTKPAAKTIKILHVANLTEVKDQATLLKSFKEIIKTHHATLRIVGEDYLNGELQLLAEELGIEHHVAFIGPVPYREILAHYAWADVMLHTSLYEGLPSAIVEAMASGVVVVSTQVGIVADLGEGYFGICPMKYEKEIAIKLISIWDNQPLYDALRRKSLVWAQSHSADWTSRQFEQLYDQVLNGKA